MEGIRSTGGTITNFVRNILGTYTPSDPTSMAGADWEYIVSGILLIMSFWLIYKLIVRIFK